MTISDNDVYYDNLVLHVDSERNVVHLRIANLGVVAKKHSVIFCRSRGVSCVTNRILSLVFVKSIGVSP